MCDVCNTLGLDYRFRTKDKPLKTCYLYKVYAGARAKVTLCVIHDIELFKFGESNFLRNNIEFANTLAMKKGDFI